MGLFRPSGDDELANAADGGAVTTNDLKAAGGLGGLMGALGGLGQLGPAVDTIAAAFLAQAEQLAAIARSVHRAEAQRKVLAFPTSGSSVVLPENDWQTLVVANAGTTDISVSLDGDPLTWPVASGAPGLPTLVALPLAGVRQVTVTGQTQPVYAIATTQVGSVDVLLPGAAQDGTDATGANAGTQATSGVGIRGWLSTLVGLFQGVGAKVQGLGIPGTPAGGVVTVQGGVPQGQVPVAIAGTTRDEVGVGGEASLLVQSNGSGAASWTLLSVFNGTSWDRARIPSVFKTIAAVAITAGTPVAVWTPASGKKFRLMGGAVSLSVAGYILFEDNSGTVVWQSPTLLAGTPYNLPDNFGNGILSAAANNPLYLDVSASGTVNGGVFGTEE